MMPQIYEAIETAIASGVPPQYITALLTKSGWPPSLVDEALDAWMLAHGRRQQRTDFREWIKKYQRKAFPSVLIIAFVGIINSGIMLLKPWPTKIMVDSVFGTVPAPGPLEPYTHTSTLILLTSLLTIAIFLSSAAVGLLKEYLLLKLGFWLNRGIKEESFRHILHLPLYHQERLAKGDYVHRQNVVTESLSGLVLGTTTSIVESVVMIIGVLLIMLSFSVPLTIISVVLVPFLFMLIKYFGPILGRISHMMAELASKTASTITEAVDNAETVQSFTLEEKQISLVNKLWHQSYELSRKALLLGKMFRTSNSLLIILGTSAVMYFGGTAALNKEITLGQLLIFMIYMGYLLGPVENVAAQIAERNQKRMDVSRIHQVLADHEGIENLRQGNHFPIQAGRIEFQNVSYAYNDQMVLKDINLVIEAGQRVGIIGPSGSGKSTILKLLPLFIEPTQGRIMIDNFDIQTVSQQELRRNISWIAQSPQLFSETIYENLQDANIYDGVDPENVKQALEVANVKEFLGQLPMGLESPAGEGGGSLSGGQRQRIAIARGLLKDTPILCMDEPTAALDSKSENAIRDSLLSVIRGKTVLMVTHRKALLKLMDAIYVLENGVLKNVNQLGGLDAYLDKIEGIERKPEQQKNKEAVKFDKLLKEFTVHQARERAKRQEQERQRQIEAALAAQVQKPSDGTIYIDHSN